MKVVLIAICKNEEAMLPFFFDHYKDIVDEYIFFDNMSTDHTHEIINSHANTHIITVNTLNYMKEELNTLIRNDAFRNLKTGADWFIIVDIDEMIYHPENKLREYLQDCMDRNVLLPGVKGYNMYSDTFPEYGKPIIEQANRGFYSVPYSKRAVVHKNMLEMNYIYGSHKCKPVGNGNTDPNVVLSLLHYRVNNISYVYPSGHTFLPKRWSYHTNELIPRAYVELEHLVFAKEVEAKLSLPICPKEFKDEYKAIEAKAEQGDAEANFQLGYVHHMGHLVDANVEKGVKYYQKAANLGDPHALYTLGFFAFMGWGQSQNLGLAAECYLRAAQQGLVECQFRYAMLVGFHDNYPKRDRAVAEHWLKEAANNGHAFACHFLTTIIPDDRVEERRIYLKKGADLGNLLCLYNYACYQYNQKNFEEAFRYFLRSANLGSNDGYKQVDRMIKHNLGCPDDLEGSIEWFNVKMDRATVI